MKTVLILILGFTVFKKPIDIRNVIGITIAMVGWVIALVYCMHKQNMCVITDIIVCLYRVVSYTEIRRRESAKPVLPTTSSVDVNARGKPNDSNKWLRNQSSYMSRAPQYI